MKTLPVVLALVATVTLTLFAAQEAAAPTSPSIAKDSRCFELRTYTPMPGKLEALNARFRDHTTALFKKHGMENVAYWISTDGPTNKLIYVLAHKSREAATQSWNAFRNDPDWQKAQRDSEASGRLVERVESVFLAATDYSPMK